MAKVKKPIKKVWGEIEKDKKAPIELVQKENDAGIVRVKKVKKSNI